MSSRPRPALSLCLGLLSFLLGPITGIPAMVLDFRGLRALQDKFSTKGVRPHLLAGIATGLLGTLFISGVCYLAVIEVFWPAVGRQVDRIFRDIEKERFGERYDSFWPAFREVAPDSLYRAADKRWPRMTFQSIKYINGSAWLGPSGNLIHRNTLQEAAGPIIAMGKPAVPCLLKWVRHREWYVRYVAIYSLEKITQQETMAQYHDPINADTQREAIQIWQKWYDEQP
jgi:hypothetical protein